MIEEDEQASWNVVLMSSSSVFALFAMDSTSRSVAALFQL